MIIDALPLIKAFIKLCRRHRRCGFNPWVGKILWRKTWQSIQYPGESHEKRSLANYSPLGHKESDMTGAT